MVVEWSDRAETRLKEIFNYYLGVAGETTARKITGRIHEYADVLGSMPLGGPVESLLEDQPEGYRYIVVKRLHKVIYFIADDKVIISTVFDCRRDPAKLRESVLSTKKQTSL
jgi:plasmid stabilization system protein ParE